jgi:predicted MPP superfamily phosphohydrolase
MSPRALFLLRFLAIFSLLMGGLHWYVWRRLVTDVAPSRNVRRVAAVAYGLLIAIFLYGGMGGRFAGESPLWARWTANVWIGLLGLLVCALFTLDAVRLAARLVGRKLPPPSPERRRFLARAIAGTAATASAALSGFAIYQGTRRVRVKPVEITLDKLDHKHDGYRLVQISDVHVGPTLGKDFVDEIVAEIEALKPDLLVITGDLVDGDVAELSPLLASLGRVRPRDGVFFCTGNHEYYAGAQQWLEYLPTLGIRPLQNARVRLPAFELAGVPDWTAKDFPGALQADVTEAVAGRDPAVPLVLLAHQPRHAYDAMDEGVDLQLSGHTHGGQMFPMTLLIHLAYPFITGLYRRGPFQIYVSPGTGYWGPPMRLGTEAEITHITLRAKA